jgi:hypothetical protein
VLLNVHNAKVMLQNYQIKLKEESASSSLAEKAKHVTSDPQWLECARFRNAKGFTIIAGNSSSLPFHRI